MKFAYANAKKEHAEFILFGVPDESGSHAVRKGVKRGPDVIRKVSIKEQMVKADSYYISSRGELKTKVYDAGNIKKSAVEQTASKVAKAKKRLAIFGGDHSITYPAVKGLAGVHKDIFIIYFDAHPDMVPTRGKYFGSVLHDILSLKNTKAVLVGARAIEPVEKKTIAKAKLKTFTSLDVYEKGMKKIIADIKKHVGKKKVYVSIDLDVLDPVFAPGVSTPYPGGVSAQDMTYAARELAKLDVIGFDIMEYTPKYDLHERTAHLASVLALELFDSFGSLR